MKKKKIYALEDQRCLLKHQQEICDERIESHRQKLPKRRKKELAKMDDQIIRDMQKRRAQLGKQIDMIDAKLKKAEKEQNRRARAHALIQVGGMCESILGKMDDYTNKDELEARTREVSRLLNIAIYAEDHAGMIVQPGAIDDFLFDHEEEFREYIRNWDANYAYNAEFDEDEFEDEFENVFDKPDIN